MNLDQASPVLQPSKLWTRAEILAKPSLVPKAPGVYAWYFRHLPLDTDTAACHRFGESLLLYVGIATSAPPKSGKPSSTQTLRHRIQYHLRGNAEGSSLRLSLGCLLAPSLNLELRRVGSSGKRLTFAAGEPRLSAWLEAHARVTWLEHPEPWKIESLLIQALSLPLNLDQNEHHPFHTQLTAARAAARARARVLPVFQP